METITITAADLDETGTCAKPIGHDCHLVIEADLGTVRFLGALYVKGSIEAKAGSDIEAVLGIKAGEDIDAGGGLRAGESIEAGGGVRAGWDIEAGWCIEAGGGIRAGWDIEAGWCISAGSGIEAGGGIRACESIKAGGGIKAGWGIEAGLSISAKSISSGMRIFAGLCIWRLPEPEETEIRAKLLNGTVAFGTLVEPTETEEATL